MGGDGAAAPSGGSAPSTGRQRRSPRRVRRHGAAAGSRAAVECAAPGPGAVKTGRVPVHGVRPALRYAFRERRPCPRGGRHARLSAMPLAQGAEKCRCGLNTGEASAAGTVATRSRSRAAADRPPSQPALSRPAWWAPYGFAAIPTAALDPPHSAASPAVPALVGSGSPSWPAAAPPWRRYRPVGAGRRFRPTRQLPLSAPSLRRSSGTPREGSGDTCRCSALSGRCGATTGHTRLPAPD